MAESPKNTFERFSRAMGTVGDVVASSEGDRSDPSQMLKALIRNGGEEEKVLEDIEFPELDLSQEKLSGEDNNPLIFRNCTIDSLIAEDAEFDLPIKFIGCEIGALDLEEARCHYDFVIEESTVEYIDAFEARFNRNFEFLSSTLAGLGHFNEAVFDDDSYFDRSTFEGRAEFRGSRFSGSSNRLDDNASFEKTTFADEADFSESQFGFASFLHSHFKAEALFEGVRFDGDVIFTSARFEELADFDEAIIEHDASFDHVSFEEKADFRGFVSKGGARSLQDDANFSETTFFGEADFSDSVFRYVNFSSVQFKTVVSFENITCNGDADFQSVTFFGEAYFDEGRFHDDADFSESLFHETALFRGTNFNGGSRYVKEDATFDGVTFKKDADFEASSFTSASFYQTGFGGLINFRDSLFNNEIRFFTAATDDDAIVNFSGASLRHGSIELSYEAPVRFDLTNASVGDITFEFEGHNSRDDMLDFVRICDTEFGEFDRYTFDFTRYSKYLAQNGWKLHRFSRPAGDYQYDVEATPEVLERTYLKAKNAAVASGQSKEAGEFRVQRKKNSTKKHRSIAADSSQSLRTRLKNLGVVAENVFLSVTSGYGLRLPRVIFASIIAPLVLFTPLYLFGGPLFRTSAGQIGLLDLFTAEGLATAFDVASFTYITFLTVGYGNMAPEGILAYILAGSSVYVGAVLTGLILYVFFKRAEL